MKTKHQDLIRQAAAIAGALAFHYLFWQQYLGINLLLYVTFMAALLLALYPGIRQSVGFLAIAAGTVFAALMVVVSHSNTATFAVFSSFLLMLGMANQPQLRHLLFAPATGVASFALGIKEFITSLLRARVPEGTRRRGAFYIKLVVIPGAALLVFHILFSIANPRYNNLVGNAMEAVFDFLGRLISEQVFAHIVVLVAGLILAAGSLFLVPFQRFRLKEAAKPDTITRRGSKIAHELNYRIRNTFKVLDLKKEYLSALLLLGLVNALLLVVNIIDINWLWFGFVPPVGMDLAQFVHEGTYVLILSILLSMAIMLFYFRGNLNFYHHNRWLKAGAYAWIVQNAVLAISVGLRNYHYISQHGLAYKRIGVVFFLLLTLFGLGTIWFKIEKKRSLFFLLRLNTAAAYTMMLAMACVNWDSLIARVNLRHPKPENIDYPFLLSLSDKALDELYQYEVQFIDRDRELNQGNSRFQDALHRRVKTFLNDPLRDSWLSWNYPNHQTYQYLKANYKPAKPQPVSEKEVPLPEETIEPGATAAELEFE